MDISTRDREQEKIAVKKAAEALRQRLGEDALRYLALRLGYSVDDIEQGHMYHFHDEFAQWAKLPARNAEEFAVALTNAAAKDTPDWYRDARAPLPNGLKVLTLEYEKSTYESASIPTEWDIETVFGELGFCRLHDPGEITRFGRFNKTGKVCFRVDAVMTKSDCWPKSYDLETAFNFERNGLTLVHLEVTDNFAHRYEVGDEYVDWSYFEALAHFDPNPELPGEFARWALAMAERGEQWMILRNACNGNFQEMLNVLERKPAGAQEFLAEGLIPRGVVTLLLARKGVGKTNALLELAVSVAEHRATWWDFKLQPNGGFVVFLLGEGSKGEAEERVYAMNGGKWPILLRLEKYDDSTMIEDIIDKMKKSGIKVDLLILDPARKYYKGDEDSSDAVSSFFTEVESFANQTKAGLVVSHHLKRDVNPKNINEVPHWLRGSQVWLDRPRVVLAMNRRGNETTFGIPMLHGDPLHNMRASAMFSDVLKLQRNEKTFTHVPFNTGKKSASKQQQVDEPVDDGSDDERVFTTFKRLLGEGKQINSSFKHELFSFKPKGKSGSWELDDMNRTEVRAAMQRLIDAGRVLRNVNGMLRLPPK